LFVGGVSEASEITYSLLLIMITIVEALIQNQRDIFSMRLGRIKLENFSQKETGKWKF